MTSIDVITDIIIPSIIAAETPNTEDIDFKIIHEWYISENRIYRDPNNKWNLIADEWYDYINTLLPSNIKLSAITVNNESLPRTRIKGQCGYFKINHPKGIFYCAISSSSNIFDILDQELNDQ